MCVGSTHGGAGTVSYDCHYCGMHLLQEHRIAHGFIALAWLHYPLADEPFKEYEGFEIDIRMIRAVAVDIGSPRMAIPDVAKTFSFIGDGTASEVCVQYRRLAST